MLTLIKEEQIEQNYIKWVIFKKASRIKVMRACTKEHQNPLSISRNKTSQVSKLCSHFKLHFNEAEIQKQHIYKN